MSLKTTCRDLGYNASRKSPRIRDNFKVEAGGENVGNPFKPRWILWFTSPRFVHHHNQRQRPQTTLQGNNGRIDRNMSESRHDKLQQIDTKLSTVTKSWQNKCPNWQYLSKVTKICQFSVVYHVLIRTCFCQFDHCFLVMRVSRNYIRPDETTIKAIEGGFNGSHEAQLVCL